MIDEDQPTIFAIYDDEMHFNTTNDAPRVNLDLICNIDRIGSYSLSLWVRLSPNAH